MFGGATVYADGGNMGVNSPNGNQGMMGAQPPPMQGDGSSGAADGTRQSANTVVIKNLTFSPSTITVPVGTTVTWTNQDTVAHTVTAEVSGGPASGTLQPGQSYSFTFNQAGTFSYCSSLHPTAKGTVTVTSSASSPPTPSVQSPSSSAPSASASASSSASSSSTSNTFNTFNNVAPATSSKQPPSTPPPSAPPAQPETPPAAPPTPPPVAPPQENQPAMPNTGAAGTVTAFASVAVIGTGLGYIYLHLRRKLYRG